MKEKKYFKTEYTTPTSEDLYFLYGIETGIWIADVVEDSDYILKTEELSVEDIIKRFGCLLTKKLKLC